MINVLIAMELFNQSVRLLAEAGVEVRAARIYKEGNETAALMLEGARWVFEGDEMRLERIAWPAACDDRGRR